MRDPMLAANFRIEFDAQDLMHQHPPKWWDTNKQLVASISCPEGCLHRGTIGFSRWRARPVIDRYDVSKFQTQVVLRPGFFEYLPPTPQAPSVSWYLNFADPDLFGFYSGRLFAQDEMQVVEHPALGALREALLHHKITPWTVEGRWPTPVLVTGVERRCAIATEPDSTAGRPYGLYGNAFATAPAETIRQATTALIPPTRSNILAMAALPPSFGCYTFDQLNHLLMTTFCGFSAAGIESERIAPHVEAVAIHTGHWGCGAFGGNRIVTACIQILAAQLSELQQLVFSYGEVTGQHQVAEAERLLQTLAPQTTSVSELLQLIVDREFRWGVSDGN